MTQYEKAASRDIFIGRLGFGCDLLEGLTGICGERNITLGRMAAIGAVSSARVGFYDQQAREYRYHDLDQPMEIASLTGNVSIKDGQPFVHAHVTLTDDQGRAFGGHLAPGTVVFACEFVIEAFDGPAFDRGFDEQTGLPLWKLGQ